MSRSPYHVVIVGGGISGLSTAFFIMEEAEKHELSIQCAVIERDARWGGKILTNHLPNLLIEGGPDSFLTSKPWASFNEKIGRRLATSIKGTRFSKASSAQ